MADFRLDRELTVRLMQPLARWCAAQPPRIPILMYHGIRESAGHRHPYFETNTSPRVFAEHLIYLRANGYRSVPLAAIAGEGGESGLAGRQVAITFDDAYEDFYSTAVPILAEHGFTATVFVVSSFAQHPERGLNGQRHMGWRQIEECRALGHRIGSHTVTHPNLYRIPEEQLVEEIIESKRVLEENTGAGIESFAYPYAFPEHDRGFVGSLRCILHAAGYKNGVCTSIGRARPQMDALFMPRIPINTHDDLRLFAAKLSGAYDWLHFLQVLRKRMKRRSYFPQVALSR